MGGKMRTTSRMSILHSVRHGVRGSGSENSLLEAQRPRSEPWRVEGPLRTDGSLGNRDAEDLTYLITRAVEKDHVTPIPYGPIVPDRHKKEGVVALWGSLPR
jgi:hypothetical protein